MLDGLPTRLVPDRDELKYLVDSRTAERLHAAMGERLRLRSKPSGTLITSLYFDTDDQQLLAAARDPHSSTKLRVKEYDDGPFDARAWLEVKRRVGARTGKARFAVHRCAVPGLVAGTSVHAASFAAALALDELGRLRRHLSAELRPACVVAYRRWAWGTPDRSLRVTLDEHVEFFAPPPEPFGFPEPLRTQLRTPVCTLSDRGIFETKTRAPSPPWLTSLIAQLGLRTEEFSKFVAGAEAVGETWKRSAESA
jgi:hypothetical protein